MVLYKKTAQHKRNSRNKRTKKMKGGALSQRQIDLLRILSKIITWGSLGFISICTATPLIRVISGLLTSAGLDTMTASFYELIWVNLSSTIASLASAASSAGAAALDGLNVLARAGNLCAAVHATARLANPIYSFALGGIQGFIELMKNPLNFNQTINRFLSEQTGIIDKFLGDYVALGKYARSGVQATAAAQQQLYEDLKRLIGHLGSEIEEVMPKRSAAELAARDANLQWLQNSEDFIFSILSNACEGVNYSTAKLASNKERIYGCARGVAGVARQWVYYFKECAGSTIQYINKRKRSRSPSRSPPPSQREIESLATIMMTNTLPDEEASQYEDAVENLPNEEVAVMLKGISPTPRQITDTVREFNACPRRASEPPLGERPLLRARRTSLGPSGLQPPKREDVQRWQPIEESPQEKVNSSKKVKKEGGRKTRRHYKKRRGTRKL